MIRQTSNFKSDPTPNGPCAIIRNGVEISPPAPAPEPEPETYVHAQITDEDRAEAHRMVHDMALARAREEKRKPKERAEEPNLAFYGSNSKNYARQDAGRAAALRERLWRSTWVKQGRAYA